MDKYAEYSLKELEEELAKKKNEKTSFPKGMHVYDEDDPKLNVDFRQQVKQNRLLEEILAELKKISNN